MLSRSPSEDGRNDLEQGEADLAPDDDEGGRVHPSMGELKTMSQRGHCPYQRNDKGADQTTEKRLLIHIWRSGHGAPNNTY